MSTQSHNALGVYISIPFCRSKCTYCNFASGVYPASEHGRYVERLIEDMRGAAAWAREQGVELPQRVDTVYLGGGTPSLLEAELVESLFTALRSEFALDADAEITVECAPAQIADRTLDALAAAGANRVSLGVQSFVDAEAHASGRLHSRAAVLEDLQRLRAAGIHNLNIDLIAGLAGQTFDSWEESLNVLLDCNAPHASIYMLEVDEDSRLGREMLAGGARYHAGLVPSDDAIARMYERACDQLSKASLSQYEISNFSSPGSESRHNLRYWERRPYLGLGLDASSALYGDDFVLRSKTTDDLKAYLAGNVAHEMEWLGRAQQHEEAWFLGLRMNQGVDVAAIQNEFGAEMTAPAVEVVKQLATDGSLSFDGQYARLTERGRLISNDIFAEFLTSATRN